MDLEKILNPFPVKQEAVLVANSISEDSEKVEELWQICISNQKYSWRATWLLDKVYDVNPDLIRPYLPQMIELISKLDDQSKIRQFLKIISLEPLPKCISGEFINRCFDLLTSYSTAIAIKVYAMQVLYNFSLQEPDIQNELGLIIEEGMRDGSAGFCSRGRKILKKINPIH